MHCFMVYLREITQDQCIPLLENTRNYQMYKESVFNRHIISYLYKYF